VFAYAIWREMHFVNELTMADLHANLLVLRQCMESVNRKDLESARKKDGNRRKGPAVRAWRRESTPCRASSEVVYIFKSHSLLPCTFGRPEVHRHSHFKPAVCLAAVSHRGRQRKRHSHHWYLGRISLNRDERS